MNKDDLILSNTSFFRFRGWFRKQLLCEVNYLSFLNLQGEVKSQILKTKQVLSSISQQQMEQDFKTLLSVRDWRPHLLVCISLFIIKEKEKTIILMWQRVDKGSWVLPQLIISLSFNDEEFIQKATKRLSECLMIANDEFSKPRSKQDINEIRSLALSLWAVLCCMNYELDIKVFDFNILERIKVETSDNYFNIIENWHSKIKNLVES